MADGGLYLRQPFCQREQRILGVVFGDGHNHTVEQFGRALDHVQMAVGQRVETAGINRGSHCSSLKVNAQNQNPNFQGFSRWIMPVNEVPSPGLPEASSSSNGEA